MSELEEESGFTMKAGRSMVQIASQTMPAARETKQLDLFAATSQIYGEVVRRTIRE